MYKIKRFSQLSINERQFNLASDLYHSGVKRTWQKYAGRGRKKIARKIDDHITAVEKKSSDARAKQKDIANLKTVGDPNLRAKAILEAESNKAKVITDTFGNPPAASSISQIDTAKGFKDPHLTKIRSIRGLKVAEQTLDARKNGYDYAIFNIPVYGAESTFHELGHIKNANGSNGRFNKLISRMSNDKSSGYLAMVNNENKDYKTAKKWKDVVGLFKAGKSLRLEESNASRSALKSLKKAGATKEQLKTAKAHLDNAGNVYAESSSRYWYPIKNATLGNMKLK